MRRFLKVIGVCFTILFSLIFILYLSLCIYIKSKEVKVDKIVKQKLVDTFGKEILTNNTIDRKKLGKIVFSSKDDMKKLESIAHNLGVLNTIIV